MSETDSEAAQSRAGGWVERETQQDRKKQRLKQQPDACSFTQNINIKVNVKDEPASSKACSRSGLAFSSRNATFICRSRGFSDP